MPGRGMLLVALAAFCWGLSGGIAGILLARGWDPLVLAFYRGAIGLLFVLFWLVVSPHPGGLARPRTWFWAAVAGVGVAGNFAFYFISIEKGSIAVAATLMYCAPVYVYLASLALRLEESAPVKWSAIALLLTGLVLLTRIHDVMPEGITAIGIAAGLLSGLSYALFIFGFRNATRYSSPQATLTIAFVTLATLVFWLGKPDQAVEALTTQDWPLFAALGLLGAGLSFFLYVVGMRRTRPTEASIAAMVEPVTATLFGVAILGENLTALQLAGMGLILISVSAMSARKNS